MPTLLDVDDSLFEHYHTNLRNYVSTHPGGGVVISRASGGDIKEAVYTREEWKAMRQPAEQVPLETLRGQGELRTIGGRTDGYRLEMDIPTKMPQLPNIVSFDNFFLRGK